MRTIRPIFDHSLRLIWTLFAVLIVVFCVLMQRAWHPNAISVGLTILAGLMALFTAFGVVGSVCGSTTARRNLPLAMGLGSLVALAPGAVRAAMPWEDPTDFSGSPMAVLLGIVVTTVFFGVVVGIPMAMMALAARSGNRAVPESAPA